MSTEKSLKIAIVVNRFYPEVGGAETNLYFQTSLLAQRHEVSVFTPCRLKESSKKEKINRLNVFRLKDFRNLRGVYPNIRRDTLTLGVFFRILFGNFDLVQAFPAMNHNNMLAMLAAKIRRIPFVLCSFDLLDYAEIQKNTGKIDKDCLKDYTPGRFRQWMFRHCDYIFAISNREMEVFKRYNSNVGFSPVPVKIEEYEAGTFEDVNIREKYQIPASSMLFFCLGRVSKIKGQDLAVEAFCHVAEQIPDSYLLIVGRSDYEPELLGAMRRRINECGLDKRVIFTGMVERSEVLSVLKQCDIHIVPVRFMNSGAVIVESFAAGTPVIQSDAVDPNLIEEGVNGYLFPSENVEALGSAMIKSFQNRSRLKVLGEAGRQLVLKKFTYQNLIDIYESVYALCACRHNKS